MSGMLTLATKTPSRIATPPNTSRCARRFEADRHRRDCDRAAIAARPWSARLSVAGSIGAIGMFLTTLSFLATTPGSWGRIDGLLVPTAPASFSSRTFFSSVPRCGRRPKRWPQRRSSVRRRAGRPLWRKRIATDLRASPPSSLSQGARRYGNGASSRQGSTRR